MANDDFIEEARMSLRGVADVLSQISQNLLINRCNLPSENDYEEAITKYESCRHGILGRSYYLDWAKRIYSLRKSRGDHLPNDLFGEPSWDILLDLYIAFHEGSKRSIKGAWIASNSPSSTSFRYLKRLEEAGLVHRVDDLHDKRVTWLGLTKHAIWAINHICEDDRARKLRKQKSLVDSATSKVKVSV